MNKKINTQEERGQLQMMKQIKEKYEEGLMVLVGILCIMLQENIYSWFAIIFGTMMLERGIHGCYLGLKNGDIESKEQKQFEKSLISILIAVGILVRQDEALFVTGMFWGLYGLNKSADYLNEILYRISHNDRKVVLLCMACAIEAALSMILIFDPANNIEHHILILGIQLIAEGTLGMLVKLRKRKRLITKQP